MNELSYEVASRAIGEPLLAGIDPEQISQLEPEIAAGLYPIQTDMYMVALRGAATAMRQNARPEHTSRDDRLPTDEQYAAMNAAFAPARAHLQLINGVDKLIRREDNASEAYLRSHQRTVFGVLSNFLRQRSSDPEHPYQKRCYVKSPTGSGKTVLIAKLVECMKDDDHRPPKTLLLVPGKSDIKQTIGRGGRNGLAKHAPLLKVTEWSSDEKDLSGEVVVATYKGFLSGVAAGTLKREDFGLFVGDEIHKAIGLRTRTAIKEFTADMSMINFTATDEYGENHRVMDYLGERIYSMDLKEAVERGMLAPVQALIYKTNTNISTEFTRTADFSQKEFDKLIRDTARNKHADDIAQTFVENGEAVLVACAPGGDAGHAKDRAAELSRRTVIDPRTGLPRNIVAKAVHAKITTEQREEIYAQYEAGKIDVLTFVDVLNESFDSERPSVLINLRPTTSPVLAEQRLGRILRGNTLATVVDFVDESRRGQCLALHALGEYRYELGKIYGSRDIWSDAEPQERSFIIPPHIRQGFEKLSGQHLASITNSANVKKTDYPNLTIDDIAGRTGINPMALAIIGKELGVIDYRHGYAGTRSVLTPFINEQELARVQEAFMSDRFDALREKSADDLAHIAAVFYGDEDIYRLGFGRALTKYSIKLEMSRPIENLFSRIEDILHVDDKGKIPNPTIRNLVKIAEYMDPSRPERSEYITFLKAALKTADLTTISMALQDLNSGERSLELKTKPQDSDAAGESAQIATSYAYLTSEIDGRPVTICATGPTHVDAIARAYIETIAANLHANRVLYFDSEAQRNTMRGFVDGAEAQSIARIFEANGYIDLNVHEDSSQGQSSPSHDASIVMTFKQGPRAGETVALMNSSQRRSNSSDWATVRSELVDTFGLPTTDMILTSFGVVSERTRRVAQQPAKKTAMSLQELHEFMGTDNPEIYLDRLSARAGLPPMFVDVRRQGANTLARLYAQNADGSKKFQMSNVSHELEAVARLLCYDQAARLVHKIVTAAPGSEAAAAQAQKLREFGFLI